ncbi:MAG: hypothetical protein IBX46_00610 [Desulfuromonadales bacterium]|nr:hypothetical protein [Desulfuromonadales bacterium]
MAGAWLMMAAEGPLIAAIIARLGDPAINLAAYGVAYAFALVSEAPIIMLMSASTALVQEERSYRQLKYFSLSLCLGVTACLAILCIPALFSRIAIDLVGLQPLVAEHAHGALLLLLPWPAAIGMRRFYQGLLIRHGQTQRITVGTAVRLLGMSSCALLLAAYSSLDGTRIGGAALSCGVVAEVLTIRFLSAGIIRKIKACTTPHPDGELSLRHLCAFYFPLALTPVVALSVQPMITFFLGRALFPVQSLAVVPVVNGLTFLFRAIGLSYQEVAIALMGVKFVNYRRIRNFGFYLAIGATLPLIIIAFTPLSTLWLEDFSGLPPELAAFALAPLCIQAILPALTLTQSLQRGVLLHARTTTPISLATLLETAAIFILLFLLVRYSPYSGAVDAALALVCGRLLGIALLAWPNRTVLREQ